MARNKLMDLNNHLFAQLERLGDESLKSDELDIEIGRAKAITGIAKNVIENAKVCLEATRFSIREMPLNKRLPEQFKNKDE